MDRVLELTDPILLSLEAGPDMIQDLAASNDIWPFMLQQLSASAWAYVLGESICIVTRSFTAIARVERDRSEAILVLKKIDHTTPQDVTAAFREGYKVIATWTGDEAGAYRAGSPSGAAQLWTMLGGEESGEVIDPLRFSKLEVPVNPLSTSEMVSDVNGQYVVAPEGPILPQGKIDKLIAALRDKADTTEEKPIDQHPKRSAPETTMEQWPPEQETEHQAQPQPSTPQTLWEEEEEQTANLPPVGLSTGVSLEEWTEMTVPSARPLEQAALQESASTLGDFAAGQTYAIFVFDRREDFDRELENFRGSITGTLLAFWDNHPIFLHIGARLTQNIEGYRTRYRTASAALESSITRLRQHEQLLPNLQNYRNQQGTLTAEADEVIQMMHTMRMRRVLETHEGRFLARKVFGIEVTRQSLVQDLTRLSYSMMRRLIPSLLSRSRFNRRRLKYFTVQKKLESTFDKLAILERELQRRLEYQADWQALVSRQLRIQREQEEIGRFIRAASSIPGGPSSDPESLNRWLKSEWEAVKRRETLLRAWQECLTDERAWSVRTIDEPMVVLVDSSLLTLPGVTRGALVVALAQNHTAIMPGVPADCAGWIMLDLGLKTVGSGKGPGLSGDPFLATISDLAKERGLDPQEALRILGFEDRIKQGME